MNAFPRHTLTRIIAQHGRGICDSPKRLEALLRDLCGAHKREINILVGALEERVAADLMRGGKSMPREVLLVQLAQRLQDNLAYTLPAARWAVEAWAVALGVLSETELVAREEIERAKETRNSTSNIKQFTPTASNSASSAPQVHRPPAPKIAPRVVTTPTPQKPSAPSRVIVAPQQLPTNIVTPSSPSRNAPGITQTLPTQEPPRRNFKLRGCLISLLLIIVFIVGAVFVVPTIIMLLREEQARPSINEPRIN